MVMESWSQIFLETSNMYPSRHLVKPTTPVASAFPYPLVVSAVQGSAGGGGALLRSNSIPSASGATCNNEVHLKRQRHSEFGQRGRATDVVHGRMCGIPWEDDTS
jgi:hypothetical protein